MKQTPEQRREHHQTREDRRRKVYDVLLGRIEGGTGRGRGGNRRIHNAEAARRDAANLARKLNIIA